MDLEKLMGVAASFAFMTAMTGQLPKMIGALRIAQLELIKASQSPNWSKAPLLPMGGR
jgi:hypothetical protein